VAMNFDYSYRAFLITSLLFGILFLILYSFKLKSMQLSEEQNYRIDYSVEENIPDEKQDESTEKIKIETNRAFNEAEKFIANLENDRIEDPQSTENKLSEIDEAIDLSSPYDDNTAKNKSKALLDKKKSMAQNDTKSSLSNSDNSSSHKTTVSYRLIDRKAILIPNPVYTCESGGKIVINIEVNAIGKVTKAVYNKNRSTTTNGCLIDTALSYASKARFTTKANKATQLGNISYNFPGQQ